MSSPSVTVTMYDVLAGSKQGNLIRGHSERYMDLSITISTEVTL
jgi:hypothetical protein